MTDPADPDLMHASHDARAVVEDLVVRYQRNRDTYASGSYNEAQEAL